MSTSQKSILNSTLLPIVMAWSTIQLLSGIASEAVLMGQIGNDPVFATPPGFLTRPLEQAKTALANEEYAVAVESLAPLLGLDAANEDRFSEDYLLPTKRKYATRSIRREALKLIANMPSRGRAVFELKYGIPARNRLKEAIASNDSSALVAVARKYFHTQAGYAATYLLGREQLFQGDYQFARRFFDKLLNVDSARQSLNPELTILSAIAWAGSGDSKSAVEQLLKLKDRSPSLQFAWGEQIKSHTLVDQESTKEFLSELVGQLPGSISSASEQPSIRREKEWLGHRSAANLSMGIDDSLLPIPQWSVMTVGDRKQRLYSSLEILRQQSNAPSIPVFHALGLKDSIIFRDAHRVYAVDADSGKRTWIYPWSHQESVSKDDSSSLVDEKRSQQEIWLNSINGRITSDGEKIYFVESTDFGLDSRLPNSSLIQGRTTLDPRNSLVALKIIDDQGRAVEGQLAWKIETKNGDPDLADAVFLGPPLLRDQLAYVLYEKSGQIRVAALASDTGKLVWSQQLASTQSSDGYDQRLFRYRTASTPFFANGLLICPTTVGGLVAIDLTDLSLKWGFKYDALSESKYIRGLGGNDGFSPWIDDALFMLGDSLCYSPIDSRKYFVIPLETGKPRIERQKKNNWLVAGKYKEMLVLVGPDSLTLDPVNRFSGFKIEYGQYGKPVGTGVFAGKYLYLPFSARRLLKIDLEDRKVVEVSSPAFDLGNLSYYRGRVISCSATGVQAFWHKSAATSEIAKAPKSIDDASRWLIQAQIYDAEKRKDDAIQALIKSIEITPIEMSKSYLSRLLISRIQQGGSINWTLMKTGFDLLNNPFHQRAYLLAKIEKPLAGDSGSEEIDDLLSLIDLYDRDYRVPQDLDGTDLDPKDDLVLIGQNYSVSGLRLVRSRIREKLEALSAARQKELINELNFKFDKSIASGNIAKLRTLTELLGEFSFVADRIEPLVRLVLNSNRRGELIWAETLLLETLNDKTRGTEQRIQLLRGLLRLKERIYEDSDPYSRDLLRSSLKSIAHQLTNVDAIQENNQKQELMRLIQNKISKLGSPVKTDYPDGLTRIDLYKDADVDFLFVDAQERRHPSQLRQMERLAPLKFKIEFDERGYFLIRDQFGQLVFQDDSRTRGSRHTNHRFEQSQYHVAGDLIILSCGYDHVAMDLSRIASLQPERSPLNESDLLVGESTDAEFAVLWRHNTFQPARSTGTTRMRRESNSLGVVSRELFDAEGFRVCKTGHLSSTGYVFLSGETLTCLDPWTGQICWQRKGVASGSDLLSDDQNLFVISPDDRQIDVFQKLDGAKSGQMNVPANMINRFAQQGTNILSLREDQGLVFVYGFRLDPAKAKLVWSREFPTGSKAAIVDRVSLAVLTPEGEFYLINSESGQVISQFELKLDHAFSTIQIEKFGQELLLIANRKTHSQIESARTEIGGRARPVLRVEGSAFLLNPSGSVWQSAAMMDGYDLVLNHPQSTPAIVFKKLNKKDKTTELLFVRLSDGSQIRFTQPINHIGVTTNVRFLPGKKLLTFNLGYHWLALQLTDFPRPPQPPAQTGKYSSLPKRSLLPKKDKNASRDLFLESNDPFNSTSSTLINWVENEWASNPMNPSRRVKK